LFYDVKVLSPATPTRFPSLNDIFLSVNKFLSVKVFFIDDERFWVQKQHTERMCISSIIRFAVHL